MTATLVFTVYGKAEAQGSARAFMPKGGRFPVVTHDNPRVRGWRDRIADAASRALNGSGQFANGPVRIVAEFYLPRPKSLPKRRTPPHMKAPDVDKLARSLGDALSGVLYRDDSQVVQMKVSKFYAGVGESPRAVIAVTAL